MFTGRSHTDSADMLAWASNRHIKCRVECHIAQTRENARAHTPHTHVLDDLDMDPNVNGRAVASPLFCRELEAASLIVAKRLEIRRADIGDNHLTKVGTDHTSGYLSAVLSLTDVSA